MEDLAEKGGNENEDDEEICEEPKRQQIVKSVTDLHRLKIEKLMKNPDKPIIIPELPKEKDYMQTVPTFVRNVMGSSAGAGSGEFHVYRHLRRKEYARQRCIQIKSMREQMDEEYHQKLDQNRLESEMKTAKKRAKRLKRKQRVKQQKKAEAGSDDKNEKQDDSEENEDASEDDAEDAQKSEEKTDRKETMEIQVDSMEYTTGLDTKVGGVDNKELDDKNRAKENDNHTDQIHKPDVEVTIIKVDNEHESEEIMDAGNPNESTELTSQDYSGDSKLKEKVVDQNESQFTKSKDIKDVDFTKEKLEDHNETATESKVQASS